MAFNFSLLKWSNSGSNLGLGFSWLILNTSFKKTSILFFSKRLLSRVRCLLSLLLPTEQTKCLDIFGLNFLVCFPD